MQTRVQIGPETIKAAASSAGEAASASVIHDFNDTVQPYLTLRQRGRSVSWLVRAFGRSRRLGSAIGQHKDPEFLGLRDAREKGRLAYHDLAQSRGAAPQAAAWTWADLDREFQASLTEHRLVGKRIKPPSAGTQSDVRLMFGKAAIASLGPRLLTTLLPLDVTRAIETIHAAHGHRVASKALAYVKSALSWALSKRGERSGLHGTMPWWAALRPPDPTGSEIVAMRDRKKALTMAKVRFTVDHLGDLLTRHEAFCADRTAQDLIGPGVRYGLWFLSFTGGRRGSTTAFERSDLMQSDPFGRRGWGRAAWNEESMKGGAEFWLPLPPAVLSIANAGIADWSRLVRNEHGEICSRWVFASTRRFGRRPDNDDVATFPNSLNAHLRAMRGEKRGPNFGINALKGLPWFTLHLVRSIAGNYLDDCRGVPKAAISAMLAHADDPVDDRLAPTTRAHYVQNQRMVLKAQAMAAWSEALQRAVERAGGRMPATTAKPRLSKLRSTAA